mgnify:CR=1 FL=1
MIRSMTGYGTAAGTSGKLALTVETEEVYSVGLAKRTDNAVCLEGDHFNARGRELLVGLRVVEPELHLVAALAELNPACRIRIGSLEPGPCALETIPAMAEHANVCRFLHLPVQSGADRILLSMRRPYTAKDVVRTAELASERMPGLGLGCDIITGFPGETDLEFVATKGLLKRLPFNNAHIFPYSMRPGTLAAGFPLEVPRPIRTARAHELSQIIKQKRIKFAQSYVGKTVEIIVEDAEKSSGWTGEYLPARPVSGTAPRKSSLRLFITKIKDDHLYGRITT